MINVAMKDDRIALVKIQVNFALQEEKVMNESAITPFEYSSKYSLEDQYDFVNMAMDMTQIDTDELDIDDYILFQETLDIKVLIDDRNIVNLN